MEFRVLGPLEVEVGGDPVPLGGAKQRALLAVLLLNANQVVSTDRLIDALWGEEALATAEHTLQVHISQLRKALRSAPTSSADAALVTRPPGYMLHVDRHSLDLHVFEDLAAEGRQAMADGDPARAAKGLAAALDLWRGQPLAEFAYERFAETDIARLEELRLSTLEDRVDVDLVLGRHSDLVGELRRLVAGSPLRERLRGQLMLALYRSGRQAEALQAYQEARRMLTDELGIDPSPALQRLERAILVQDPDLDRREPSVPAVVDAKPGADAGARATIQTFLIADIRGYTLFTQERGDEAAADLASRFAQLSKEVADSRGGAVLELRRDEALAVFPSAREAIRAAVELQERFVDETVADPAMPLAVGIGLDAGEPIPVEGGYRGGAINLAARLSTLAGPGEILASREVVHLARRVEGVTQLEPPPVRLKGFPDPVHVVKLRREGWEPSEDVAFRRALGPAAAQLEAEAQRLELPNPYKGLRPFEEADAAIFFGRESLTDELVTRLREARFLAVVGPSGSGKSSVVRAGLIPAIRKGALPGSAGWLVIDMLPGSYPLEELEAALLRVAAHPLASLIEQLERDELGLLRAVKRVLPADGSELVLIIDQLEEVFTLVDDEDRRAHFLSSIRAAAEDPRGRVRVVTTLRADFYDQPLLYRGFADLVSSHAQAVVPLAPDELERAVVNPARSVDVGFEPGLLPEIVAEVVDEPGALPSLQYALTELFDRRDGNTLTLDAYRAMGGVAGGLAGRADQLYEALDPSGREACRQLFLRLVNVGEGSEDTRRRVPRAELEDMEVDQEALTHAIDVFGASRLLSFDRDMRTAEPTVEVAHEALLRSWARLRGWIEATREDMRMDRRLSAATAEWTAAGREPSFLLRGSHLGEFESWITASDVVLTGAERGYLESSLAEREAQDAADRQRRAREAALERRSVNRLRVGVALLTIAATVASVLTVEASNQKRRADEQARIADARQFAAAALANLEADPERSILLALEAVDVTRSVDGTTLREAEEALHQAVQASRIEMRLDARPAAVEYSPDGARLATAGTNAVVSTNQPIDQGTDAVVWDTSTGARLLTLGHDSRVWDVEFSPDGSRLATSSEDGRIAIWDSGTGERLLDIGAHDAGRLVQIDFSPDGTTLVSTDGAGSETAGWIRLWDPRNGHLQREWSAPAAICGISFSPDGNRVGGGACSFTGRHVGKAFVWNLRTGERVLVLQAHPEPILDFDFSADGGRIATVSTDRDAKLWDAATGREVLTLAGHGGLVTGVVLSPDGRHVATASTDGTVRVWDTRTGAPVLVLSGHGGANNDVEFSPDGSHVVSGGSSGTVTWDVTPSGGRERVTMTVGGAVKGLTYSPDGSKLLATSFIDGGGEATLWDASSGRRIRTFSGPDADFDAAFSPDGASIVTAATDGAPVVWDAGSGEVRRILDVEGFIASVAVSPDGSLIATGLGPSSIGGGITIWDASSGALVWSRKETAESEGVDFGPDGTQLAAASAEGPVTVWAVASGDQLETFRGHEGFVTGVAFSPDGRLVASSGVDGTARIWSMATGRQLHSLVAHSGVVWNVAFSPNGKLVATAGDDNTARVWDVSSGRELLTLTGHTRGVTRVAFSPDGTMLATSSNDGTVRVHVLPVDELVRLARSRLTRGWTAAECRQYLRLADCPSPA